MRTPVLAPALVCVALLSACGGGGGGTSEENTPVDNVAPAMTSLNATTVDAQTLRLTASATDAVGVTGYCFREDGSKPAADDACFQADASKDLSLTDGLKLQHVWAKDAAGLVSAEALRGPCSPAGLAASDAASASTVCMMTSLGEMVFELAPQQAPTTTANFLSYVNNGFYTGTVFHRVISNFMVQGGGFDESLTQKTTAAPIQLEAPSTTGLSNTSGTIAMARTSVLNSATSQFFVNVDDNTFLDTSGGGYAVFGALIAGQTTLEAIRQLETSTRSGLADVPVNLPVIQWAVQLR